MKTYLAGFLLALFTAVALTPIVRWIAFRFGALDHPEPGRKHHKVAVPRIGGVALLFAVVVPLAGFYLYPQGTVIQTVRQAQGYFTGIFVGAALTCLVGLVDDLRGMNALLKLALQIGVAGIMFAMGFRIEVISVPFGATLALHWMSLPATLFWYIAVVNAINLIDGLDGLAAGQSLITCIVLFVIGLVAVNTVLAMAAAILIGALLGFLLFNFNPAKIFLGDSGSNLVGFLLATFAIMGRVKGQTAVALFAPLIALGLPFLDVLLSVIRRFATSQPIFGGDAKHIHHLLLQRGYSQRGAALFLYGTAILFAGAGLVTFLSRNTAVISLLSMVLIVSVIGIIRYLGYHQMQWFPFQGPHQLDTGIARRIRTFIGEVVTPSTEGMTTWDGLLDAAIRHGFCEVVAMPLTGSEPKPRQFRRSSVESVANQSTVCSRHQMLLRNGTLLDLLFRWPAETGQFGPKPHEAALLQVLVDILQQSPLASRAPADSSLERKEQQQQRQVNLLLGGADS